MEFGAKTMLKIKKRAAKASTPNPFAGKKDIYLTTNKIAVTTTTNTTAKRGHTKVTKTKYYKRNARNMRALKAAQGDTVRVGRTGTNYKKI